VHFKGKQQTTIVEHGTFNKTISSPTVNRCDTGALTKLAPVFYLMDFREHRVLPGREQEGVSPLRQYRSMRDLNGLRDGGCD